MSTGTFSHIYVCYKSRGDEPLYELLAEKVGDENITFFTDLSLFPDAVMCLKGTSLLFLTIKLEKIKKNKKSSLNIAYVVGKKDVL